MNFSDRTYKTIIIAHRGESRDAPENTMASIKLAWSRGADGVEVDVHLSGDNEIVAIHNKKVKTAYHKNVPVKSLNFDSLRKLSAGGERIPALEEILLSVPAGKQLFIEIKCGTEIIPFLKSALNRSHLDPAQLKIIGFGLEKMSVIKKYLPEYEVLLNKRIIVKNILSGKLFWNNLVNKIRMHSLNGLNLNYCRSVNHKLIEKFRINKLKIYVWTVNDPLKALRLIEMGIDGIMSDRAGWIRKKIREQ